MLSYAVFKAYQEKTSEVAGVTNRLKESAGAYYKAMTDYASALRTFAETARLPFAPQLSDVEARLITAATDAKGERIRNRKLLDKLAAELNKELQSLSADFLNEYKKPFEEAASVWRQMLVKLLAAKITPDVPTALAFVQNDAELYPYYLHILGQVGAQNAALILQTEIYKANTQMYET